MCNSMCVSIRSNSWWMPIFCIYGSYNVQCVMESRSLWFMEFGVTSTREKSLFHLRRRRNNMTTGVFVWLVCCSTNHNLLTLPLSPPFPPLLEATPILFLILYHHDVVCIGRFFYTTHILNWHFIWQIEH